jgi:EAL and modified HD-GYP domain-containing signal transduction protein
MLGLFSLLDAMLDSPMDDLMAQIPVTDEISRALVHKTGGLFPYLQLIQWYEAGEWHKMDTVMAGLDLDEQKIVEFYLDAVHWAEIFI